MGEHFQINKPSMGEVKDILGATRDVFDTPTACNGL